MYKHLLAVLSLLAVTAGLQAQTSDYPAYPRMDIDYRHLDLELRVDASLNLIGEAEYLFRSRRTNPDSLYLHAPGIDVTLVSFEGGELAYRVDDDRLIVRLPDGIAEGEDNRIRIEYRAAPAFGIHQDDWGTIWTSLLPGSVRHWLPVFDHPRSSFTTDVRLIFPSGMRAVFSGDPSGTGVETVDELYTLFRSDVPVPATSLAFAIGEFDQDQVSAGGHTLHLHSRRGLLNESQKEGLLELARDFFSHSRSAAGMAYPRNSLHLVVVDDDHWETKHYGAGVVFIYHSKGNLENQAVRGIAAQWYGILLREEQWADSEAILLLQEWLARDFISPADPQTAERVSTLSDDLSYARFGTNERTRGSAYLASGTGADFQRVFRRHASGLLLDRTGVINWHDFASILYEKSGQPFFTPPELPPYETGGESGHIYRVVYHLEEEEGELRLTFTAEGESIDELVSVEAEEFTFQDSRIREIAFTGGEDVVVLTVSSTIENLVLTVVDDHSVTLREEKPITFWIHQLRNSDDPGRRKTAAAGLRDHADDPDLQLALLDLLRGEEHPEVQAEILLTLAENTRGASGTAQHFLGRYRPDAPESFQKAIVKAYRNYQGNEQIIRSLESAIRETPYRSVREEAVRSLAELTGPEQFRSLTESLIQREEVIPVVPLLLELLADKGEAEPAVRMANVLLNPGYPYQLRSGGLRILLDYDESAESWRERLPGLLADRDPRIRYQSADALQHLPSGERSGLIEERLYEEYDERIRRRLAGF